MTSLCRSGGSGDGGGGSSGSSGGRTSSHCGAVRWGVSGGGQMQLQRSQRESLPPQQLREWYASTSGGGGSSGSRCAAIQLGVSGGGLVQLQRHPRETPPPLQLREWHAQRGASQSSARCPYVIRIGAWAGHTCETIGHTQSGCFSCLSDTSRAEFGIAAELPRWLELLRQSVDIFALDYDAILTAMYALPISTEGDCSLCVLPDLGIETAALGASESALPGTAPAEALHTFTIDSGASRCFFRGSTTLTPLSAPEPVRLADPSGGPVLACSSTVLPCPAIPSGSQSSLHLPSFSTNLVSTAALQDAMVTTTTPGGQRVSICTCTRTGRHLATFTRRPGSSLYTLATEPPQIAASAQVSASGPVPPPCSYHLLPHLTLLWHRRLGHPSQPRLCGMHSRLLVSGLPRSLPPLPPSPALPCLPCVEGRQRAAPHYSSFPLTTAPLQTLHMDTVANFASGSAKTFQSYVCTLTEVVSSPLTSCGTFVVGRAFFGLRCASAQPLAPCLLAGDLANTASVFPVWGSCAFVRDMSADKLSARVIPCIFLGFPPDAPSWQFYHPTSHRVFPSQDVTFDESVPFYRLFPYCSTAPPPPPLFLAPGPPPVDPLPPQGPAPSGVSQVDPLPGTMPVEVAVDSGAAGGAASGGVELGGAEPGGAESRGAEPGGAEPGGAEPKGVEPGGADSECVESRGAEPWGIASSGGPAGASPRLSPWSEPLSPQQLREWFTKRTRLWREAARAGNSAAGDTGPGAAGAGDSAAGDTGAGGVGVTRLGGAGVTAGAGGTGGSAGTGSVGGAGAGDSTEPGAGGAGAGGVVSGGSGAGGTVQPRPYFVPLLQMVLGVLSSPGRTPPLLCPPPDTSQPLLQPASSLPTPSPYTEQAGGLTERREPASCPASHVRTDRRVPRPRPPPVPGTHAMVLRPSSVPLRVPLPPPPKSSLLAVPDPKSDRARAASPTVSRLLATFVTDPSFESTAASAFVAELVEFADACRLDYATTFVADSESASPPSVGGQCALGTDVLKDKKEDFESLAAAVPHLVAMLLAPEGDRMHQKSRPRALTQRRLRDLVYVDDLVFATADTEALALVKSKLQKRHTCTDLGELHSYLGLQITRDIARRTITLTQSHMVHQVLQHFGFRYSLPQPTPLSTSHSLSAPPSDESVEPSGSYPELVGCLMYLMTCTRPDLAYPLSLLARYMAPGRHRKAPHAASCVLLLLLLLLLLLMLLLLLLPPLSATPTCCAAMASLRVLAFDHEGCPLQFDTWLDDLQLYLLSDSRDSVLLFDHTSSAAPAPPDTADSATHSQWLTCDAAARLAIHNHLLLAECAHFGQHRTAQTLYDAVVARYSSPATAALGRLLLPYLFPEFSAFATVEDLVTHLRTSNARYRAALPAEFLDKNPPPMYITLHFIVTCLPDSLCSIRDHFLYLDPTSLTFDLLEQHLLAAETSAVAVGVAHGAPRTPFFEGCSPSPLTPFYASAAAVNVLSTEDVGAASACGKHRSSKGKGGRGDGGGTGSGGGGSSGGSGGGGSDGSGEGSGGVGGGGGGIGGSGGSGSGGSGGGRTGAQRGELLRSGVAIFDLHYDAILFAMYALSVSAEGDCYRCVPPDPGIDAAAQGARESVLPAEALHTFTLDSSASRCFFRDSTTLTPLPAPVPVRLADPSGGPDVSRSSTVLPCPAVPSRSLSGLHLPSFYTNLESTATLQDAMVTTTTPRGQRVSICTCIRTGRHLVMFSRRPRSSLYTVATKPPHVAASAQVSALGPVASPCSCRLLSHLWHHRLGHPSTNAPLQTLVMDVWGPALVSGQGRERYFLLVVDDYARYATVFPLRSKGEVVYVLIPWIYGVRLQLRERFRADLAVLRLHSGRGGEFSSDLLRDIFVGRAFSIMEVARTSMIHAAAPHFLWPFAVRYAAHQLNLWPRVSFPETSPTLGLDGEGWRCVGVPGRPSPCAESGGAEPGVAESEGAGSGGAEPWGEEPGGAEPAGVEPGGVESEGVKSGGAEPQGAALSGDPAGASPRLSPQQMREWLVWRARLRSGATRARGAGVTGRAGGTGGTAATGPGGSRTRGTGAAGTGGVEGAGAEDPTEPGAVGAGGSGTGGTGAGRAGAGGAGVGGTGAGGAGAGGTDAGGARVGGTGAGGAGAGGA
ncbi:unnamed protein product [Closterium sp. NIES-54]